MRPQFPSVTRVPSRGGPHGYPQGPRFSPDPRAAWAVVPPGRRSWPRCPPLSHSSPATARHSPQAGAPRGSNGGWSSPYDSHYNRRVPNMRSPLQSPQNWRADQHRKSQYSAMSQGDCHEFPRQSPSPLSQGTRTNYGSKSGHGHFYKPSMSEDPWMGLQPVIHSVENHQTSMRPNAHCLPRPQSSQQNHTERQPLRQTFR
ncbi:M-phase-specific PLK1-interacting protein isoform X2 [Amia ocellicauda]|uniref:M-phase-specific PLK1-interacting protein isoform X2 n=1 Tax=Amia ocellicauda TaxID=2972642 RepID=UPI0034648C83